MAARVGFEPAALQTQSTKLTIEPPRPIWRELVRTRSLTQPINHSTDQSNLTNQINNCCENDENLTEVVWAEIHRNSRVHVNSN